MLYFENCLVITDFICLTGLEHHIPIFTDQDHYFEFCAWNLTLIAFEKVRQRINLINDNVKLFLVYCSVTFIVPSKYAQSRKHSVHTTSRGNMIYSL
jgi:hypothetical protein